MYFLFLIFISAFICSPTQAVPKTNPDISVNILLLGKKSFPKIEVKKEHHEEKHSEEDDHKENDHEEERGQESHNHRHNTGDGLSIQEIEFYFKSNIDPYWRGDVSLGIAQHEGGFEIDLEEAFIESLFIPSLTIRAGKFYAFLGRHNNLHTHYYPFIDPPLINQTLFGFHGWNEAGTSFAYLSPLPWYSEIIVQAFYSHNEIDKLSGILFFKNLWDLTDSATLELDLSYGTKVKNFKHLYNASLIWKWKPLSSARGHNLAWTTEWLQAVGESSANSAGGLNSYIQWQFLKNWWLEGRTEYLFHSKWNDVEAHKHSLLLAFAATEYSAIRLQYDTTKQDSMKWEHSISIQSNMSLGTHPAHLY